MGFHRAFIGWLWPMRLTARTISTCLPLRGAFMRIVNRDNDAEIARFDLSEDYSTETAMVFGEVYRHNGEWKFKAVGQGYAGGLFALCSHHGVNVN